MGRMTIHLGIDYESGRGVPQNYVEALLIYNNVAEMNTAYNFIMSSGDEFV